LNSNNVSKGKEEKYEHVMEIRESEALFLLQPKQVRTSNHLVIGQLPTSQNLTRASSP
jgi:hypothetical protein